MTDTKKTETDCEWALERMKEKLDQFEVLIAPLFVKTLHFATPPPKNREGLYELYTSLWALNAIITDPTVSVENDRRWRDLYDRVVKKMDDVAKQLRGVAYPDEEFGVPMHKNLWMNCRALFEAAAMVGATVRALEPESPSESRPVHSSVRAFSDQLVRLIDEISGMPYAELVNPWIGGMKGGTTDEGVIEW